MKLSKSTSRKLIHQRRIHCNGYLRDDGLWDIEAHLTDDKGYPLPTLQRGILPVGDLVHDIWLRLTLNNDLVIQQAEASLETTPFKRCPEIEPNVSRLIGLKIKSGWTSKAIPLIGGIQGCSHLVELLRPMATTAIQTIYPYLTFSEDGKFPVNDSLLNSCHGFSDVGDVIEVLAPEKFVGNKASAEHNADDGMKL